MVWWWGDGKIPILRLLSKLFWEVHPAGMTDHPKEARLREEPLGACREGYREKTPTPWQERVPRQANK